MALAHTLLSMPDNPRELIGRTIAAKYRIESFIGEGAMGAVYRARQIELDKEIAIKVLHARLAQDSTFVARFKREAKAASLIDHKNSMRVLDFGQEPDGLLYIAMELLEGPSLRDVINKDKPLDQARVKDLTRQVLAALAAAHDRQIIHRDLKPENVIVSRTTDDEGHVIETVKVCDFGIAKVGWESATTAKASKLTGHGSIVGTPDYMSPEQARGLGEIDARSDLYSVGVMMFEMLAGRLPFVADTPLGVVLMHLNEPPPDLATLRPDVDPALESATLRALAKRAEDRFATAREMRAALAEDSSSKVDLPRVTRPKLVLAPEPSVVTGVEPSAPTSMRRAQDTLREAEDAPRSSRLWVVLVLLALVGGGGYAARRFLFKPAQGAPVAQPPELPSSAPLNASSGHDAPPPLLPANTGATAPSAAAVGAPTTSARATVVLARGDAGSKAGNAVTSGPELDAAVGPRNPAALHVALGAVTAEHISTAEVTAAMPMAKFEECYRERTKDLAKVPTGLVKVHFALAPGETNATVVVSSEMMPVSGCIADAAKAIALAVDAGSAVADADLHFKAD